MNILFLSHYFPPEVNAPASRTFEHCKEWVRLGHQVTVVSCVPHHPIGKAFPGYKNRFYHVEHVDGIKAIKILTYITANEGFAKRIFNYFFYMVMAILVAPFLGKADVVVSTSPQFFNGLAGYFVSRIKRAKWVLEIRDLWPESIVAVGALKNQRVIGFLEGLENFAYHKADHIVSVTNTFKQHFIARGVPDAKVSVIRNGVDLNLFHVAQPDQAYANELGIGGKFVASYVGTHGMAHGLTTILDAAEILKDNTDIVFLMVGDGAERDALVADKKRRQLHNVVMLHQLPKDAMPKIWSISSASLVLLKRLDLFKAVIPSKIFESMAMGTPIVLGVEGEVQQIIQEANAGLCIQPENAQALADALKTLQADKQLQKTIGHDAQQYVQGNFDRSMLAKQYEQVLLSLTQ